MMCRRAVLCLAVCLSVSAGPILSAPASECPAGTPEDQQVFVASNSSCTEFYLCSNGVPFLLTCPGDLYFNQDSGQCDYRGNVNCTITASTTSSPTPTSPSLASSSEGLSSVELDALLSESLESDSDPVCPEQVGPYPVLLPNPANCSTYFICFEGAAVLRPCPAGLLFNNDTWTCDYPEHVVCPQTDETPVAAAALSRFLATRSVSVETPNSSDQCPRVDGKYPVFLPNPDDCSSFYMCSHGVAFLETCPDGLLFNNDTWTCDYPQNVDCNQTETETVLRPLSPKSLRPGSFELTFDNGCPTVDGKYPVLLPNPANCSTFYMCSHGVPFLHSCPPGLQFNNGTWSCDFPWRARCSETATPAAAPGLLSRLVSAAEAVGGCPEKDGLYPVLLPNPSNCSTFYMCSHGVPYLHSCAEGLYFNNNTWTCDFPANVPCGSS